MSATRNNTTKTGLTPISAGEVHLLLYNCTWHTSVLCLSLYKTKKLSSGLIEWVSIYTCVLVKTGLIAQYTDHQRWKLLKTYKKYLDSILFWRPKRNLIIWPKNSILWHPAGCTLKPLSLKAFEPHSFKCGQQFHEKGCTSHRWHLVILP